MTTKINTAHGIIGDTHTRELRSQLWDRFVGYQSPAEFLENGGQTYEYARWALTEAAQSDEDISDLTEEESRPDLLLQPADGLRRTRGP